jgi:hypothetical protein
MVSVLDYFLGRAATDRVAQAKLAGSARGALEAKLFRLSRSGKSPDYQQALDWLQAIVDEGRTELETQHAFERELSGWEMSCRIAFMVRLADLHGRAPLVSEPLDFKPE